MSVKGGLPAKRTLDARSTALKVRKATGVGVGLGGEPQPRTGTLSGFDVGFAFEGLGERSAQASGIVTREGRNRQIAVSAASRARPDAQHFIIKLASYQRKQADPLYSVWGLSMQRRWMARRLHHLGGLASAW